MSEQAKTVQSIAYGTDAQARLLAGVSLVARSVASTLGPGGRTVAYKNRFGETSVTKDGVTVARLIRPEDPFERMGADLVREVASSAEDTSGDGTTTATILTHSLIESSLKAINVGMNPVLLKAGIQAARDAVQAMLAKHVIPVTDENTDQIIRNIAVVSSNNDTEIVDNIVAAYSHVGKGGVVSVETSDMPNTSLSVVKGMAFDRGFEHQYFINDAKSHSASFIAPKILLLDGQLSLTHMEDMARLLGPLFKESIPLIIVAEKYTPEVVAAFVAKRVETNGQLQVCLVKTPGYGDRRFENLEDIAAFTGAHIVSEKLGRPLSKVTAAVMGDLSSAVVKHDTTTLVGNETEAIAKAVDERIEFLEGVITAANTEFDEARYRERIARLRGGIAVIRVGATLDGEMRELKERYDDTLGAVKSALSEGVVVGGGITLYDIQSTIGIPNVNLDYDTGFGIVVKSLTAPIETLITNRAGYALANSNVGRMLAELDRVRDSNTEGDVVYGYNASTNQISDLMADGILDPAKVLRTSLNFAVSTCILVLSTDTVLAEVPV